MYRLLADYKSIIWFICKLIPNIEVFYTGEFLSNWLKSDSKIITI